jgi:hypothetical protein
LRPPPDSARLHRAGCALANAQPRNKTIQNTIFSLAIKPIILHRLALRIAFAE